MIPVSVIHFYEGSIMYRVSHLEYETAAFIADDRAVQDN